MRALSIRQPFAELILRGIKTVEYRSRPTRIIGERFWIYAAKGKAPERRRDSFDVVRAGSATEGPTVWSRDLSVMQKSPDVGELTRVAWMVEIAQQLRLIEPDLDKLGKALALLPRGVIVGTAVIQRCVPIAGHGLAPSHYAWHLGEVERAERLRRPKRMPQPVWFSPF